jgi:hypothetical protein
VPTAPATPDETGKQDRVDDTTIVLPPRKPPA